jgi:chromosome segregation ATPase
MVPSIIRPMKSIVTQDISKIALGVYRGRQFSSDITTSNIENIKTTIEELSKKITKVQEDGNSDRLQLAELKGERKDDFMRFGVGSAGFVGGIYYIHRRLDDTNTRIDDTNTRIADTNTRINDTKSELKGKIDDTKSELKGKIDDTNKRIDDTNARIGDLSSRVETLQQSVNSTNIMLGRIAEKLQV